MNFTPHTRIYVFVCVCERESEREAGKSVRKRGTVCVYVCDISTGKLCKVNSLMTLRFTHSIFRRHRIHMSQVVTLQTERY